MVFLMMMMMMMMMNTWCSKRVENTKNWIKPLIWKVYVCWFTLHKYITMHGTQNIKFYHIVLKILFNRKIRKRGMLINYVRPLCWHTRPADIYCTECVSAYQQYLLLTNYTQPHVFLIHFLRVTRAPKTVMDHSRKKTYFPSFILENLKYSGQLSPSSPLHSIQNWDLGDLLIRI